MSLDGYIAGPNGEYDWIVPDPDVDFGEMMAPFDTFLIGRKTFETMLRAGNAKPPAGIDYFVFSNTLKAADHPGVAISNDPVHTVQELREKPGKDIALFGGGDLFRTLLRAGLVDRVEVSIVPVLLGGGVPLLPQPADRAKLKLRSQRVYEKSGTVRLEYEIARYGLSNRTAPAR